jgi:hypothetical protein
LKTGRLKAGGSVDDPGGNEHGADKKRNCQEASKKPGQIFDIHWDYLLGAVRNVISANWQLNANPGDYHHDRGET